MLAPYTCARSYNAGEGARATLLALVEFLPVLRVCGADVVGAGTDEAIVVVLLDDVGGPAADSADGEDGGEEIDVDAEQCGRSRRSRSRRWR